MSGVDREFSWRSVALSVFLPTTLFSIGEGALLPIIPVIADSLGATLAVAGLILAMLMVGELAGDVPSGWLVVRIGERNAMISGALLAIAGVLIALTVSSPLGLGVGILLVGVATAIFALARHALLTSFVPISHRARALSTLGGIFRAGWFVGPIIGSLVIYFTGSVEGVLWVTVVVCLVVVVILLVLPDPEKAFKAAKRVRSIVGEEVDPGEAEVAAESSGIFRTLWESRGALARIGVGAGLFAALRASRIAVLPLWAVSIGLSGADTALIIGVAGGIEFALFYVSGHVMDRFGRRWGAMPAMIGLGTGHLVLAFTHDLPSATAWFIVIAMTLGLANGLSAGVVMTLGADLAPVRNPAPFLGGYRLVTDTGAAAAPLAIAAITALTTLSAAVAVMGIIGYVGAGMLWRYIPRYIPRRPPT